MKALGVSTKERLVALPNVPSLHEAGVKDYAYDAWIMLIGPAGMPQNLVDKLANATRNAMQDKAVLDTLSPGGFVSQGTDSAVAAQTLANELERSARLVKAAGITPQ